MTTDKFPPVPGEDRLQAHHREQLSALLDGELAADQARFLLRRLAHDQELAGCQERWQLVGDVLRGRFDALAPPDFADRVGAALAAEPAPAAASSAGHRRRWWAGGGALAAALALLAVLPWSGSGPATAPAPPPVAAAAPVPVAEPLTPAVETLPAVGLATSPQPAAAAGSPARPPAAPRPARPPARPAAPVPDPGPVLAAGAAAAPSSPFAIGGEPEARPWPRSVAPADSRFSARLPVAPAATPFDPEVAARRLEAPAPDRMP